MTDRLRREVGVLFCITCILLCQVPGTVARGAPAPGFSFQVTPTRLVIPAGAATATQKFVVTNGGRLPFMVNVQKADFTAMEDGALNFKPDAPYAASGWARITPTHFLIKPGTSQNVTFHISRPDRAEPGDHQLALIFKVPAGRNAANIRINRGIATPVFMAVPGSADRTVEVTPLRAPGFATHGPIYLSTRVHDSGTVHRDFRGKGKMHVEVGGGRVSFPDFTVMRDSTREVTARWNPPLMCVCHATLSVPGSNAKASPAAVQIIIFPVHLAAALFGVLMILLLLGWFVRRRFRAKVLAAASALSADQAANDDGRSD
ncbi:hypothetical protein [Actinomadura sp. DC4]|uniref:hypothetical protein n=1 Tax=Actinomadura sp. DC4 TaxID=3055069 RepID=UPI0025B191D0|nr:hypothetical protein [Actinomadura sp. DC4]MDN3358964.1 hypothetical protein [Actinomadura sp. DC4]